MALILTDAQRKTITGKLFLFKDPPPALSPPANNDAQFTTRMTPVAQNPRFKDVSFAVVDFTADRFNPRIFLHKADIPWRMGSTGKIAVLLAAAQLRDDVQNVKEALDAAGLVASPTDFDDLFSTIWSGHKDQVVRRIGGKDGSPRVSTIFDLSQPIPDFQGAGDIIDKRLDRLDYALRWDKDNEKDSWEKVGTIDFQDRLWLMGAQSDNASAQSCISAIGLAYMKEVQRAYGLLQPKKGMHMLLGGGYFQEPRTLVSTYRYLRGRDYEKNWVTDRYFDSNAPQLSTQPGSVAALTAYMIALIQDKLVNAAGCVEIKLFLADGGKLPNSDPSRPPRDPTLPGSLFEGVQKIPGVTMGHFSFGKGGALEQAPQKAERPLRCDVAYIETTGSAARKFAIVAQGLVPFKDGASSSSQDKQGEDLAQAIHAALIAP
jgi:hypothetical protein